MGLLIFDLEGKFAHFRKYDTNSSSLTYSAPPRTVICGMIAAILGMEKNSYYSLFIPQKAKIGVRILSKNHKVMQSLNYWKTEGTKDFRTPTNHTQIPFEVLTNQQKVAYRIYFEHEDTSICMELEKRLKEQKYYFAPYLGAAPFQCYINNVEYITEEQINNQEKLPFATIVRICDIEEDSVEFHNGSFVLTRERMPRYFDENRYLEEASSYLLELNGKPLIMKCNGEVRKVQYKDGEEYITFL